MIVMINKTKNVNQAIERYEFKFQFFLLVSAFYPILREIMDNDSVRQII